MAIYQCRRRLIDGVNSLHLPFGTYVKTECLTWVNRFGEDLVPVGGDPTGSGYIVKELTNLVEEQITQLEPAQPITELSDSPVSAEESSVPLSETPSVRTQRAPRRKEVRR